MNVRKISHIKYVENLLFSIVECSSYFLTTCPPTNTSHYIKNCFTDSSSHAPDRLTSETCTIFCLLQNTKANRVQKRAHSTGLPIKVTRERDISFRLSVSPHVKTRADRRGHGHGPAFLLRNEFRDHRNAIGLTALLVFRDFENLVTALIDNETL